MGVEGTGSTWVDEAFSWVGPSWPLDRAIAVNPLLDRVATPFVTAAAEMGARLGVDPWPSPAHRAEAERRYGEPRGGTGEDPIPARPGTALERAVGARSRVSRQARALVAETLVAVSTDRRPEEPFERRVAGVLASRPAWGRIPSRWRAGVVTRLATMGLEDLLDELGPWSDEERIEELTRHVLRVPGWAAWAKWCDQWSREEHRARIHREDLLRLSLSVDLAGLERVGRTAGAPSRPSVHDEGRRRLEELEAVVHSRFLGRLGRSSGDLRRPVELQVLTCIDPRSEPLRRAFELDPAVETLSMAGFFGVEAALWEDGDQAPRDALPVLLAPRAVITGGSPETRGAGERRGLRQVVADLTHEPEAMFALAEVTGWAAAPWMLTSTVAPRLRSLETGPRGSWTLTGPGQVAMAEGALRVAGLTREFAPNVLIVGHGARSSGNPHFATLGCGACASLSGVANAAALAGLLNQEATRRALLERGIKIPESTRFWWAEHVTTEDLVHLEPGAPEALRARVDRASATLREELDERWRDLTGWRRRSGAVRARDLSDVRPEWGLAGHCAVVVGPRRSTRGIDLEGSSFLHSYEAPEDSDGAVLRSILAAPVVVAHWINAAYYFSSVAPEVLGAGDKSLLNPIDDFAVLSGTDPDPRWGLADQSLSVAGRPFHLPVRLLVAVEAPLERIAAAVRAEPLVERLVEGEWVLLAGRESPAEGWRRWRPGEGWAEER